MFKPFSRLLRSAPAIAVAALLAGSPGAQGASGITTAQIMAETVTALPSCLNYQVTGVCFFLVCSVWPPSCWIEESLKVQHYMPDDVVSTWDSSPDQHPWIDVGKMLSGLFKGPGDSLMGAITDSQADTWEQMPTRENIVLFKSASAIGNPVEAIIGGNMNFEFPDFNELMNFPTTGMSQISQMWSQVPSQLISSTQVNVNSMFQDAQKFFGQLGTLSRQFGGTLSSAGSQTGNLSSDFKGVISDAKNGGQNGFGYQGNGFGYQGNGLGNGLGNGFGQSSSFSDTLTQSGFDLSSVGSEGSSGFDQMGDTQSMQDTMNQLGSIMGNALSSDDNNFSSSSSMSALGDMNSLICPGGSGLFTVNYDSNLDNLFWRGVIPLEQLYPGSWIPGVGEVGNGLVNTWGSTYPRIGQLTQAHPVKASAVIAARVASIIEQSAQPHLYKKLSGKGNKKYFKVAKDPRWQMLYPVASSGCTTFGQNDSLGLTSYGDGKTSGNNGYVWNLWHKYECCQKKGAFLFAVP